MKTLTTLAALTTLGLGITLASPAFAASPAESLAASAPAPRGFSTTFQLELLPRGHFEVSDSGSGTTHASGDLKAAFGISGTFGYDVIPHVSVGIAPRLVLGVAAAKSEAESMRELDLRGRVAVHARIASVAELYGFVAPGYSWVTPPEGTGAEGAVVAFGAGITGDIDSTFFMSLELGYQKGFQTLRTGGNELDSTFDFYSVGIGAGARF